MSIVTTSDLLLLVHGDIPTPHRPNYEYNPLPAHGWIRVLTLQPASSRDSLICGLQLRRIDDAEAPGFEAVSYVWGSSDGHEEGVPVECDGLFMRIGENLAAALIHIRHESEIKHVWVDALCIDQENIEERSTQVQQMGEIYASSSRVLIWLGPDNFNEAEECFALVQDTTRTLSEMITKHGSVNLIPQISSESKLICSDTQMWAKVQRLMDLDWFTRIWCLQEVGLCRSATMLYGKATLNWACLVELMLIVASRADVSSMVGNIKWGMIWDLYEDLWRSYDNTVSWRNEMPMTKSLSLKGTEDRASFINILNDGRSYSATDQRDRVYAFLSHPSAARCSHRQEQIFVADYHLSVDQVYLVTAKCILETDTSPWMVLTCVDHAADRLPPASKRPSWVPRWDEGWSVYWLGYKEMWYRAGGDDPAAFQFEHSSTDSTLGLRGIILDSIVWTSRKFDADELRLEPQRQHAPLQQLWQDLQRHDHDNGVYGLWSDQERAFSLVIAAGRAADEGPAEDDPDHHRAVYRAYKKMVMRSKSGTQRSRVSNEDQMKGAEDLNEDRKAIELEALTYIGSSQRRALHNRRFFRTKKGYYGIAHRTVRTGDLCCVFRGANMPFVVRGEGVSQGSIVGGKRKRGLSACVVDRYLLVGEAYVQGIMRGELFRDQGNLRSDLHEQRVILV